MFVTDWCSIVIGICAGFAEMYREYWLFGKVQINAVFLLSTICVILLTISIVSLFCVSILCCSVLLFLVWLRLVTITSTIFSWPSTSSTIPSDPICP